MNVCGLFSLDAVNNSIYSQRKYVKELPFGCLGSLCSTVAHTLSALLFPSMLIPVFYVTFSGLIMVLIAFIEYQL